MSPKLEKLFEQVSRCMLDKNAGQALKGSSHLNDVIRR